MNIALCHYRVGETDGVSLEMDKCKKVLENMGHKVYFVAGSTGTSDGYIIPEMNYRFKEDLKIGRNAYLKLKDYQDEDELIGAIRKQALKIEEGLKKILIENKIDLIIPNNIFSIGRSIPTAMALANVIKELGIRCIGHHHDFHWERDNFSQPTCNFVRKALEGYYPPKDDLISHVVINSIAQKELKARRNLDSIIIPNVFDFNEKLWDVDDYNIDFREKLGIKDNDILMLQATRVTNRKAIELAIDVVGETQKEENRKILEEAKLYNGKSFKEDSRIVLVLAGMIEAADDYVERLKTRAKESNVELLFVNNLVEHSRCVRNNNKVYSLWDTYVFADIVTYPSIQEGWGNQFLEGLFAKKPMLVFEYDVYKEDIKRKGFKVISLGDRYELDEYGLAKVDKKIIKRAAGECIKLLIDKDYREKMVEENFQLGREFFSLKSLKEKLKMII
ncbi:MAG: glycosyltransferase family 4 protein [Candidatus Atribacteria bacterium]|nr:glycosyltransferase family 4 protein [bacterium]MCG2762346.1 glycosyltransferase family 4 protein [Candidatus Atribacteria bacterium]